MGLHGCQLFKHLWVILSCMAVNFSSISGILILHGCELFKHLWKNLQLLKRLWGILLAWLSHGCELFKHPRNIYPARLRAFKHLWDILSCMALGSSTISGTISNISGTPYPQWLSAFQASLGHPILHGRELYKHLWYIQASLEYLP